MRRALLVPVVVLVVASLAGCGGDDSSAATTAAETTVAPTTTATDSTTTLPTSTTIATTTSSPDPALAPPCNVGEVKVNREAKVFFEPGDPRYGTVPAALVICLPDATVAQGEGFAPAPPP